MKTALNNKIRKVVENGNYISKGYYDELDIKNEDYHYYIRTEDNIFHFQHKGGDIILPLKDVDWKIFWDKLGNIPVNDDEEIEERFEHFEAYTETSDIWHWFEWFFDISIGEEIFKN